MLPKTDRLSSLVAQAAAQKARKDYDEAAELYSLATELQAKMRGELDPANADLLHQYGYCLYQVAIKRSEVLGSRPQEDEQHDGKYQVDSSTYAEPQSTENGQTKIANDQDTVAKVSTESGLFRFSEVDETGLALQDGDTSDPGEENMEDSPEEDDFNVAFEVLDLARVLYIKQLEATDSLPDNDKSPTHAVKRRTEIKKCLADVHDLQAEISLEGESFEVATEDFKAALSIKKEIYNFSSNTIAEAYFKLALALEFLSKTSKSTVSGQDTSSLQTSAEQLREDAVQAMQSALASCKARLDVERQSGNVKDSKFEDDVNNVTSIITEMEEKLHELQNPGLEDDSNELDFAKSADILKSKVYDLTANANDVNDLIKRKSEGRKRKRASEHVSESAEHSKEQKIDV